MGVELGLLGPLEVRRDGVAVQPRSAKQRLLLAVLAVHVNEVVPASALVDALWGDEPPATAGGLLHNYVSALRKVLEPADAPGRPTVLVTADPGYRLTLSADQVDASRFERLVGDGRQARREGRPDDAADLLREALGLWRGAALADVADADAVRIEALRLDELRIVATEERVDADIALGRHGELVGELQALVATHPLRERLWAQLMLCLYRVGRQADALAAFHHLRHQLAEDLGLDPSPELAALERDILSHAPTLDWQPLPAGGRDEAPGATATTRRHGGDERLRLPPSLRAERRSPLVGRDDARGVVEHALTLAPDERAAILVAGEPGIGKTRLVAEVAAAAHDDGAIVLLGRCVQELIAPFGPWAEALGELVERGDEQLLRPCLERSGGVLARLLPSIPRRFGRLPAPPPVDAATERRRLADAIDDLLGCVAADWPLVVVLEDLHWADEASLAVLSHVLRPGAPSGLAVLGTYRDTELGRRHPLSATLASLRRLPQVTRVSLSGLEHDALAELITSHAGHEPTDEFVTALEAETEGNPFFAIEVLRHLAETGAYEQRDGRWVRTRPLAEIGLPEGVREVVGRRLSTLSEEANTTLGLAAVVGAEVDVAILRAVVGPEVDVLEAVDEVVRAGLLREAPGPPGRYAFRHALIRQTLLDELSGGHRARAHWQIGEALTAQRPERLDEIAYHLTEGVLAGDPGRAVDAALAAGKQALDRPLPDNAALQYGRALTTIELTELSDPERQWATLIGYAEAAAMSVDTKMTVDLCFRAISLAERMSWPERVAEAALQATELIDFFVVPAETFAPIIDRNLTAATEPVDQVRLLIARSRLQLGRDVGAARDGAVEAMAVARRAGAWSWFLEASAAHWFPTSFGRPLEEERALAEEVLAVAARPDVAAPRRIRPVSNYTTFCHMGPAIREGDRKTIEAQLEFAETTFFGENRLGYHLWTAMLALADGRLEDVDRTAQQLEEEFPGFVLALKAAGRMRGEVLIERGDPEGLALFASSSIGLGPIAPVVILNHASARWPDQAPGVDVVDEALAVLDATDPSFWTGSGCAAIAEAAVRHDRPDWAERVEQKLRRLGGVYLSGLSGTNISPMDRALAQVLLALGDLDQAVAAAERAVAADQRFGADALLLRSRQWLAIALLRRVRGDGYERATGELQQALTDARRLGYVLVADECERLLDR